MSEHKWVAQIEKLFDKKRLWLLIERRAYFYFILLFYFFDFNKCSFFREYCF